MSYHNDPYRVDYLKIYPCLKERPDVLEVLKKSDRKMKYMEVDLKSEQRRKNAENQSTEKKNTRQIQMTIEGHKVTVSFAQEANPTLSALVRNTLLDAYIRKNGLCGEEQPA